LSTEFSSKMEQKGDGRLYIKVKGDNN